MHDGNLSISMYTYVYAFQLSGHATAVNFEAGKAIFASTGRHPKGTRAPKSLNVVGVKGSDERHSSWYRARTEMEDAPDAQPRR